MVLTSVSFFDIISPILKKEPASYRTVRSACSVPTLVSLFGRKFTCSRTEDLQEKKARSAIFSLPWWPYLRQRRSRSVAQRFAHNKQSRPINPIPPQSPNRKPKLNPRPYHPVLPQRPLRRRRVQPQLHRHRSLRLLPSPPHSSKHQPLTAPAPSGSTATPACITSPAPAGTAKPNRANTWRKPTHKKRATAPPARNEDSIYSGI